MPGLTATSFLQGWQRVVAARWVSPALSNPWRSQAQFYGFKLHLVINHKGEIMAVKITPGNVDDRKPLDAMTKGLKGKRLVDKGYISGELFRKLWHRGLHLLTGIRKNMKNHLMPIWDKLLLRKRFIVETLFDKLKSEMGLEHTGHRSPTNAFVHILSCIAAYMLGKQKVKMKNSPYP